MTQLQTLIEEIPKYQPAANLDLLERAYRFSERSHQGQQRASGEPYLSHPLEVAGLLVNFKMDVTTVTAGLLHDVLEDTKATKGDLQREFGAEIADLVDGVTKIGKLAFSSREERQAENFRKMLVAMARDLRVLMIKLADRLHNMRTLQYLPTEKARKIAQETLDIYAPLAHRLGMAKVKAELEDLALRVLHPEDYQELMRRVAKRRLEREAEINHLITLLHEKLGEVGIGSKIAGRPKHFYSIWKKMHEGGREFDEIYDLTAVRVLTNTVRDCYGALGVVHSLWKPVPGRFKDFIAMPKVNMYQSLHTTVIGPKGDPVEIQIRTSEMHRIAEEGIAAHWLYKEKRSDRDKFDDAFTWLRQLLESQKETSDPKEFLDSVRLDLFPDEVYVFTPRGDVKALPDGATPVDFAYTVHTDVGHHCVGAKVNGKLVPLRYTLHQGDIVEIVTSPTQHPSRDWLKIVKSNRARAKINQWLKIEERTRSLALGRELFDREARKYRLVPATLLASDEMKKLIGELGFPSVDDLLASIGYGKTSIQQVLGRVAPAPPAESETVAEAKPARPARKADGPAVRIRGVDDLLVRFGKCCAPVPGDSIVGFITRGRGLTVHARDCLTVAKNVLEKERLVAVEWDGGESTKRPVRIAVYIGRDRPGLLAEITSAISSRQGNIIKAEITVTEDRKGLNHFVVEVDDLRQLQDIMQAIRDVKDIANVERVRGV
ncbi:MAG TPA: bifunctional (p)ppGpp synthetase/guanosine-3',5'-bis(diphosphate) 3'-pyrophosphohydrolase [Candidatus Deferrimicrobiaceae bacterium]|nr:bifunctional (p)ppGpp synthetase/guanosine-3',5'-bis(diphosphate) 3'-pyrophosphohydrolase [Candidatus Deferrimicrobiaceae bacterium]